jgi:lysophospholipase L1-like esterase
LPFIRSSTALANVKLSALSADIRKSIWWFGDSYSSNAPERVIGQLNQLGVIGNMLINAVPGMRSYYSENTGGYVDFCKLINISKPKYVIWSYGMNDTEANYKGYLLRVKNICDVYNIELYAVKVPSVPGIDNSGKSAYIDELGVKSIDWAKAVGATSAGVWREGYLSGDNVHPTVKGAQALAARTLVDCPALMQF